MRLLLLIFVCLVNLLHIPEGNSFVVSRTHVGKSASTTTSSTTGMGSVLVMRMASKKSRDVVARQNEKEKKENEKKKTTSNVFEDMMGRIKEDPVGEILRILITGSPDGVAMLGKPQHNWSTGKPMTKEEMERIQKKKKK